jgi:hypothetical protein
VSATSSSFGPSLGYLRSFSFSATLANPTLIIEWQGTPILFRSASVVGASIAEVDIDPAWRHDPAKQPL